MVIFDLVVLDWLNRALYRLRTSELVQLAGTLFLLTLVGVGVAAFHALVLYLPLRWLGVDFWQVAAWLVVVSVLVIYGWFLFILTKQGAR